MASEPVTIYPETCVSLLHVSLLKYLQMLNCLLVSTRQHPKALGLLSLIAHLSDVTGSSNHTFAL